jgi:hypothetical protein
MSTKLTFLSNPSDVSFRLAISSWTEVAKKLKIKSYAVVQQSYVYLRFGLDSTRVPAVRILLEEEHYDKRHDLLGSEPDIITPGNDSGHYWIKAQGLEMVKLVFVCAGGNYPSKLIPVVDTTSSRFGTVPSGNLWFHDIGIEDGESVPVLATPYQLYHAMMEVKIDDNADPQDAPSLELIRLIDWMAQIMVKEESELSVDQLKQLEGHAAYLDRMYRWTVSFRHLGFQLPFPTTPNYPYSYPPNVSLFKLSASKIVSNRHLLVNSRFQSIQAPATRGADEDEETHGSANYKPCIPISNPSLEQLKKAMRIFDKMAMTAKLKYRHVGPLAAVLKNWKPVFQFTSLEVSCMNVLIRPNNNELLAEIGKDGGIGIGSGGEWLIIIDGDRGIPITVERTEENGSFGEFTMDATQIPIGDPLTQIDWLRPKKKMITLTSPGSGVPKFDVTQSVYEFWHWHFHNKEQTL